MAPCRWYMCIIINDIIFFSLAKVCTFIMTTKHPIYSFNLISEFGGHLWTPFYKQTIPYLVYFWMAPFCTYAWLWPT
jgi:hypothetical protein